MSGNTFTNASLFWLLAGILIGVAASFAMGRLWQQSQAKLGQKRSVGIAAVLAFAVVAFAIYTTLGRPDIVAGTPATTSHATSASGTGENADPKSMEAVTAQLATRLGRDGGSDSDWQLLAQSYDFMGRADDAAQARKHVVQVAAAATAMPSGNASGAGDAMIAAANAERIQRHYDKARAAYEAIIQANAMTADSWADYADVLASSQVAAQGKSKLAGAPAQAIDKALALNPNHMKALWLKASLAHEERRYGDALVSWRHLRSVIGDNESDARIIDANIAEAEQLAGSPANQVSKTTAKPAKSAAKLSDKSAKSTEINGTIEIDPKLLARAVSGTTIFIFAKTDSPGPPLAVFRTTVGKWPMSFKLDDSMAMMPSRNLSSATEVIVEARISQSGQAAATAGDLQAPAARVKVGDGKAVRLRIEKVVS